MLLQLPPCKILPRPDDNCRTRCVNCHAIPHGPTWQHPVKNTPRNARREQASAFAHKTKVQTLDNPSPWTVRTIGYPVENNGAPKNVLPTMQNRNPNKIQSNQTADSHQLERKSVTGRIPNHGFRGGIYLMNGHTERDQRFIYENLHTPVRRRHSNILAWN